MSHTVVGIFDNQSEAQRAIDHLITAGFTSDQIDLSLNRTDSVTSVNSEVRTESESGSGISRFFNNLFSDDEEEARRYSTVGSRGNVVTVHTYSQEEAERAADILDEYGTVNVEERATTYSNSADVTTNNVMSDYSNVTSDSLRDESGTIQVLEEDLQVGKREVQTGGVRVRSRIVERPVEETLRLREERAWIERTPVNRAATDADLANFREETIEVTEFAERPVVSKSTRVVEEISVGKKVEEREETIRDSVRRTEVDVEENTSRRDSNLI